MFSRNLRFKDVRTWKGNSEQKIFFFFFQFFFNISFHLNVKLEIKSLVKIYQIPQFLNLCPQYLRNDMFLLYAGSFAGLVYLSWYLSGKIRVFDRRGHVAKLCLVFLPVLVAAMIAVSRVDDYWHHWQDVFAGGLIG